MFRTHLHNIELNEFEQQMRSRMHRHVDVLASLIGPRHFAKYEMLLAAEKYVEAELAKTNFAIERQTYEIRGKPVANLIAEQRGQTDPKRIIVVGAHYDTVYCTPGADDNASAVAGMLEIAHCLSKRKFKRTIRYVGFVNEEPPFYKTDDMGSLRYARLCRERGDRIVGMINLEMIGCFLDKPQSQHYPPLAGLEKLLPKRGNFIVICSNLGSLKLLTRIAWGFRRAVRFPMLPFAAPKKVAGPDMSDNWSFWQCGYPAVMVTDTSFLRNGRYHTMEDRPETLNLPAMTRVVRGVMESVARLAGPVD